MLLVFLLKLVFVGKELQPVNDRWMNEQMNEWMRGLFSRLCHVFEVWVDGSYLSIWRGNHVVVDAFSQRAVTWRTNLSIKGTGTHKYHQRGVNAEFQSSSFLPFASGTRATVCVWNYSRNGPFGSPRSCDNIHLLGYSGGTSLVCDLLLKENVSVFTVRRPKTVLISFYRTVNNVLMSGPKVNTFCALYDFRAHALHNVNLQTILNWHFLFSPSRLCWSMQTVSKLAHRGAYRNANISSRGRDGTAQRTLCNYLHTVACEEVRSTSYYRTFGSQVTE